MKGVPTLVLAAGLLVQVCLPGFASDSLAQGIRLFRVGQYAQAAQYLKRAAGSQPFNQKAQYFLASSLSNLNDKQGASHAFESCFRIDPFTPLGMKAKKALLGLPDKNNPITVVNPSITPPGSNERPDDANSIRQAIVAMHRQTQDAEQRVRLEGEMLANAHAKHVQTQVSQIWAQAKQDEEDLAPIGSRRRFLEDQLYQINLQARYAEARARQEAQVLATQKRRYAAERAVALNDVATNLESLLAEPRRPGHIRLKSSGTNLYVRNYESEPAPPPVELVATQHVITSGQSAAGTRVVGSVSGRLLNR